MTAAAQLSRLRTSRWTYAGLFMATLATLMYEIVLTRIFSVTMWYHFAFVAISVALFGMTVGALIVHLFPKMFCEEDVKKRLWIFSLLFAISIPVCFVTQLSIPFVPRASSLAALWSVVLTCIVISIPFVFSGVVVCLALTRFPDRVNRLYAADLIGAAVGCILLVMLLGRLDGPSAVIFIGSLAALSSLLFAADAHAKAGKWTAATAMVLLAVFAVGNGALHARGNPFLRILWAKETQDRVHEYDSWNAFSRVTVDPYAMGGLLPVGSESDNRSILIDGTAGTVLRKWDGDLSKLNDLRSEIANIGHHVRAEQGDIAVIGVGGGRDILSALEFGADSVTGIEINGNILEVTNGKYGEYSGHLDRNPKVTFARDDGRSYLTRTDKRFDIIQISLIDTWAATGAGAFALSENSLYTTEAFETYLDRLKPGGLLSITRWYQLEGWATPLEAYRTVGLAAQSLVNRGIENPRDHILVYKQQPTAIGANPATVLTSIDPFTPDDIATLNAVAESNGWTAVLTPTIAEDKTFEQLVARGGPGPVVAEFREDISPPSDNRPFFFQMADLQTVFSTDILKNTLVTRPVLVLALLAISVIGLTIMCIMVPLIVTTERTRHRGMAPFYVYFGGIGLAFLLVEIAMLQRLSIYLGNPTAALSVVLFSVLLFSGIGSMLTERFLREDRPITAIAPLCVLLAVVTIMGVAAPMIIRATNAATTPARVAIAVAMLMPLGLAMGMPFAIGMRAASARPGSPTAFLWGINGAMSVSASVLGVVIALFLGISTSYWVGALAYAVTLGAMVVITKRQPAAAATPTSMSSPAAATP